MTETTDIPASPRVLEEYVLEVLQIRPLKRDEILAAIKPKLESHGFRLPPNGILTLKKALSNLAKSGRIESPRVGYWKQRAEDSDDPGVKQAISSPVELPAAPEPLRLDPRRELGLGSESVYVWHNATDYELAQRDGKDTWPHKIGSTKSAAVARIIGQGALTAHARLPVVDLVFKTDNSHCLESGLHAVLTSAGRRLRGGAGTEWFDTSPQEIEKIWRALTALIESLESVK